MKKTRAIVMLVIAALMMSIFSACTTTANDITVTLIIEADDDVFYDGKVELSYENPTVLMAVKEVMALYELPIVLNANEDSVKDVGEYTEHDEDNIAYFWEYSINGVFPDNNTGGKANAQPINDGDVIKYVYSSYDMSQAG